MNHPSPTDRLPLGIDIAKHTFDAVVRLPTGKHPHRQFENRPAGFEALLSWLQGLLPDAEGKVHACLEATSTYGEALATCLHEQGHTVSVVNPKRIAHFAKSRLARAKTDKRDAGLIADFCQQEQPAPWTPPPLPYRHLQALLRHREALERTQQQERNRREAVALVAGGPVAFVAQSLEEHLAYLATALEALEQAIRAHLAAHPELQAQCRLLLSIPGIGETTARFLLAELAGAQRFSAARQAAAYAGLDPRIQQSGLWKGKTRISKQGNAGLRKALYFPALSALRCNPKVKELAVRLRERGKCPMAIVGAAMRKLLQLAYGVLHNGLPFDPAWHGGGTPAQVAH